MPSLPPLPSLFAALLLQASDWHLPALVPGRPTTVTLDPAREPYADLRYHALFDAELRITVQTRDEATLFLELYDSRGTRVLFEEEPGETPHELVARVHPRSPPARLRVRVGVVADGVADVVDGVPGSGRGATIDVSMVETPSRDPAWDAAIPAPGPVLDRQRELVLEQARPLSDEADVAIDAGEDAKAEELLGRIVELLGRVYPHDLPDLVHLRGTLADTRFHRNVATRAELERAIDAMERCPQIQEVDRLRLMVDLENLMARHGDDEPARALLEAILPAVERAFPPEDGEPLCARLDYALVLLGAGELRRAREIAEAALEIVLRSREPGDDLRLQARGSLVVILLQCGDAPAARALEQQNVDEIERVRPEGHRDVWAERLQLARLDAAIDDLEEAEATQAAATDALEKMLPETAELLLTARVDLARTRLKLGRPAEARDLFEKAVELAGEQKIHDSTAFAARAGLAATIGELGSRREQIEMERALLSASGEGSALGPGSVSLRSQHARTLAALGLEDELETSLHVLAYELDQSLALHPPYSFRELGETARQFEEPLSTLLSFGSGEDEIVRDWCFHWIETLRARTSGVGLVPTGTDDAQLEIRRARVIAARRAVDAVVARVRDGESGEAVAQELSEAARARDLEEQQIVAALESCGRRSVAIDAEPLAKALSPKAAAVGFRVWEAVTLDEPERGAVSREMRLLAHVIVPGRPLQRVDVGSVASVADLVVRWRADPTEELGKQLAQLVLEPIRAAAPDATALEVCLDGPLLLVPLDALPMADGKLFGERVRIHVLPSFAPLVEPRRACVTPPSLLACGGIDYGRADGAKASFAPLPATKIEAESVAALFRSTSGEAATTLVGGEAKADALRRLAPKHRFVHLATHGWIVPDPSPVAAGSRGPGERHLLALPKDPFAPVRALAPMTLCGLALADANGAVDGRGAPTGRVTAEEVAGLDLSACELVVLSACDTSLGVDTKRAGQAIQSLQAALHAAGARSSITSLWKVDDVATLDLMKAFYGALWREKRSKSEALWQAKMALRAAGEPTRRWAGWVLTGTDE